MSECVGVFAWHFRFVSAQIGFLLRQDHLTDTLENRADAILVICHRLEVTWVMQSPLVAGLSPA